MDRIRDAIGIPPITEHDGLGILVAIVDTGVDLEHPDLAEAVDVHRSEVFTLDGELLDANGHGTHVAGIIAGAGIAGPRYRGMAPRVRLVICKALGSDGKGASSNVAAAIVHAADVGAHIINLSVGRTALEIARGHAPWVWSTHRSVTEEAVAYASERGVLCVCAAGNGGPHAGSVELPGALEEALSVGYLDRAGLVAEASARGPFFRSDTLGPGEVIHTDGALPDLPAMPYLKPDVVAPGGSGRTTYSLYAEMGVDVDGVVATRSRRGHMRPVSALEADLRYARCSGSSQAAAVVSGLAALTLDYSKARGLELGKNQGRSLANLLRASADAAGLGRDTDCGHGCLSWRRVKDTVDGCIENPAVRERILAGSAPLLL